MCWLLHSMGMGVAVVWLCSFQLVSQCGGTALVARDLAWLLWLWNIMAMSRHGQPVGNWMSHFTFKKYILPGSTTPMETARYKEQRLSPLQNDGQMHSSVLFLMNFAAMRMMTSINATPPLKLALPSNLQTIQVPFLLNYQTLESGWRQLFLSGQIWFLLLGIIKDGLRFFNHTRGRKNTGWSFSLQQQFCQWVTQICLLNW